MNIFTVEKACGYCWQFWYTNYGLKLKVTPSGADCVSCTVDLSGPVPGRTPLYPDSAKHRCAGYHRFEDYIAPWSDYTKPTPYPTYAK